MQGLRIPQNFRRAGREGVGGGRVNPIPEAAGVREVPRSPGAPLKEVDLRNDKFERCIPRGYPDSGLDSAILAPDCSRGRPARPCVGVGRIDAKWKRSKSKKYSDSRARWRILSFCGSP